MTVFTFLYKVLVSNNLMEELIMVAVSKEESMLLIQHAISAFQNEGKKQKELGELLGSDGSPVSASRISEGKIGKWKLLPSQRQMIIEHYGYPRRGKGQYIKAEVYDKVTEFIDDYEDSSKKRLKRRLYELFMRKDYQGVILSYLKKDETRFYTEVQSKSLVCDISIVEELLSQPETKIWYDSYRNDYLSIDEQCNKHFKSLLTSVDSRLSTYSNDSFQKVLYRIAQFKFELMPEFSFDYDVDVPSIPRKEMIITGDEVLNFKADCCTVEFNNAADMLGKGTNFRSLLARGAIPEGSEINDKPDNWKRVILRLYLSENMHYHLWIRLDDTPHVHTFEESYDADYHAGISDDGLVRNIVIKDLCRINFLKEIEIIRKWCGWTCDFNDDIKREVAKVGGYVPGAEVL
jgi:hypothetical protein